MDDKHVVDRLHEVVRPNWKGAHILDLTDDGLLADLDKHGVDHVEELRLDQAKSEKTTPA